MTFVRPSSGSKWDFRRNNSPFRHKLQMDKWKQKLSEPFALKLDLRVVRVVRVWAVRMRRTACLCQLLASGSMKTVLVAGRRWRHSSTNLSANAGNVYIIIWSYESSKHRPFFIKKNEQVAFGPFWLCGNRLSGMRCGWHRGSKNVKSWSNTRKHHDTVS